MPTHVFPSADWKTGLQQWGLEPGRPLQASVEIAVPAADVWQAIAATGQSQQFHPFLCNDGSRTLAGAGLS